MKIIKLLLSVLLIPATIFGQTIQSSVPTKINKTERYLFYLHGRIIEEQGIQAVHPVFGEYKYSDILDSLKKYKFNVISEARPKNTNEDFYAEKVVQQLDTLLKADVSPKNIFIFGASKGAFITLLIAEKTKNKNLNFIVMGTCSEETSTEFKDRELCGNFLSFYETSDEFAGSCVSLLKDRNCVTRFQEIKLSLNKKHGFLFSPIVNGWEHWWIGRME